MSKNSGMLMNIADANINSGIKKANLPLGTMIILGIMAGAFIAFGGAASNTAVHSIENTGVARVLAGAIFPVGLMLVVFTGSELFTGNCLMITGVLDKRIRVHKMIVNLVIVYISNLIGSLIVVFLIYFSGQLDMSGGGLGAYAIKVAVAKTDISPIEGFTSGILCNILVCLAIIISGGAKEVIGKIFAIFFPIGTFVICGFEHSVANMFYIPMGILASTKPEYISKANELYGITQTQCHSLLNFNGLDSFIYVTLGNIVGGMLFIGIPFYFAIIKRIKRT